MKPFSLRSFVLLGCIACSIAQAEPVDRTGPYYVISKVPTPAGVNPQIGGLAAMPDGRLAACFHHGEVAFFDPGKQTWSIFAEGLHEPLGILVENAGNVLVMQRPELTRLRDRDGDGRADLYETVWDDFGLSGNYHEFAFGPVRGPDGKLYVGLNTASNGAPVRAEVRGTWSPIGMPREKFTSDEWPKIKAAAGRMYARVPWRGWVMQIDPATGEGTPFACGFRSPDGLGFTAAGDLLVSDNQGDWRGTSEVHVVKRGGFYGHPASLVWRKDWDGSDPLQLPVEQLQALRTPVAIAFPYDSYGNSPTQLVMIPRTPAWGPYGGQMIMGEMNFSRLFRVLPENVSGVWQGACIGFIQSASLKLGLHRLAFLGDALYVGRTHLSWLGGEGISRIRPTKIQPFEPLDMKATRSGFRITFTKPLAASATELIRWPAQRYYYAYHAAYGSPQMEKTELVPAKVTLTDDRRTAEVELKDFRAGFIYDFDLMALEADSGERPLNARIAYTLNRVPTSDPAR